MVYKSKTRTIKNKNIFKSQKGGEGESDKEEVEVTIDLYIQSTTPTLDVTNCFIPCTLSPCLPL